MITDQPSRGDFSGDYAGSLAYARAWRQVNKKWCLAYNKAWQESNRNKCHEYDKRYRAKKELALTCH